MKKLEEHEARYAAELETALKQYAELRKQAAEFDPLELYDARQAIHPEKERSAAERVQNTYGNSYNSMTMFDAKRETENLLGEEAELCASEERRRQRQKTKEQLPQQKKPRSREQDNKIYRYLIAVLWLT